MNREPRLVKEARERSKRENDKLPRKVVMYQTSRPLELKYANDSSTEVDGDGSTTPSALNAQRPFFMIRRCSCLFISSSNLSKQHQPVKIITNPQ